MLALHRVTISTAADYEHLAAATFLDVMGRLARDGAEPRWPSLKVSEPMLTP